MILLTSYAFSYAYPVIIFFWGLVIYEYINIFIFVTVYVEVSDEGLVIVKGLLREREIFIPKDCIEQVYTTFSYIFIFLFGGAFGRTQILVEVRTDDGLESFALWSKDHHTFCNALHKYLSLTCTHEERIVRFKPIA